MSVGNQTTKSITDQNLTDLSHRMRDLAVDVLEQQTFVNKIGSSGLQALGYSAGEATTVLDDFNHMATVMQVYKGTATQPTLFNFEDFLTHLWAGQ